MNEQMMKLKQQGRKIGHLTMEKENLQKQVINAFKQVKQKPIDQSEGAVLKHAAAEVNDLLKRIRTEGEDAIAVLEAELQKLLTQLEEQTVKMNMMAAVLEEKKLMYQQVMEENTKLTNEKLLMQERMEKTLDEVVRLRKAMKAQGQVEESAGMKVNVKEGKWQDEDGKWYEPATLMVILRGLRVRGAESERETRRLKVKLGEAKAALELKETENDALMIQLKCRPKVMKSKVKVEHTTTTVRSETTEMVQSPGACSQCGRSGQDHTSASPASNRGQENVFGRVPVPATPVHEQSAPEKDQNLKVIAALTQENEEFKQNLKMTKNNLDHALEEIEKLKAELEDLKSHQGQDQYMYMGPDGGMVMDMSDEEIEIMHQDYTREDTQSLHTIQESEFGAAAPDQSGLRDGRGSTLPTKSPYHPESLLPGEMPAHVHPALQREMTAAEILKKVSLSEKEVSVHLIQPDSHLPVPTRSTTLMKRLSHAPEEHLSPEEEMGPSHENLVVEEFLVKHKGVQCDLQPPVLQTRRTSHQTGSASRPSIFRSQGGFQESEQLLHTLREENKGLASSDTIPRAARKFLKSETAAAMLNGEEPTVVEWETAASLKRLQRKLDDITAHILVMTKEAMNFVSKEGGAMQTANCKIRGNISDTSLAGVQNEDEDALLTKHPALIGGAGFKHRVSQAGANCMQLTEEDPEEEEAAAVPGAAMKEKLKVLGQHAVDVFGTMMNLAYATVKYQFQDYVHLHKVMKPKHRQQMKELMNLLEVEDDDDDDDDLMYKGSRRRSSILHKYFLDNRMEQRLRKTMQVKGLRTVGSGFKLDTPPRPATDSQQEPRLVLSKSFVQLRSTVSRVGTTASDHRHELEIPKATAPRAGLPVLVVGLGNRKAAQTTYPPARKRSIQPWRDSHLYKMTALDPTYRMARPGAKVAATKLGSGFAVPMKFKEPESKTFSRPMRKAQVKSRPKEVEPHPALAAGLTFPLPTLKPTRHGLQGKRAKGTLSTSKVQENRDQGTVLPLLFVTSKQK
ncbi:Hypp7405 [Branchiostoma lanceolatum]|nr:Hypp7405 [Branchiostoma lanceolatum]